MVSPQLENGHSRIAHELLEQIYRADLSVNQFKVIFSIIRHSYGWGKKSAPMSASYLAKDIGIPDRCVTRSLKELRARNIIFRDGSMTGIQKHYDQWLPLTPASPPPDSGVTPDAHVTPDASVLKPLTRLSPPPLTPASPKKESIKERKKEVPPKERSVLTECRDFSFGDFTMRMHQKPSWATKDYVQLTALFKRKPDLTELEWKSRWKRFAESADPFDIKMGLSLGFFCTNFDRFIKDKPKVSSTRFQNWDSERSLELLMQDDTLEGTNDKTRVS